MAHPAASPGKLVSVALLSATASAALTYAVIRLRSLARDRARRPRASDHFSCCGSAPAKRDPYDASPRSGYLSWDDYFMAVAFLSAQRSKDPNKQVGACIVDQNQVICGIGYNGFPRGCPDSQLPWAKKARGGDPLQTKYPYVCHAEMNAILNKNGASVAGAKIYVTLFPCNECAKLLIQAGIKEIIYHEDKLAPRRAPSPSKDGFRPDQQYAASKKLLALAGVELRQHRFRHPVTLRLTNHPAYPVIRSVDSAAVAAESAAAAAAAAQAQAAAGPAGPDGLATGRTAAGAAAAASLQMRPRNSSTAAASAPGGLLWGLPPEVLAGFAQLGALQAQLHAGAAALGCSPALMPGESRPGGQPAGAAAWDGFPANLSAASSSPRPAPAGAADSGPDAAASPAKLPARGSYDGAVSGRSSPLRAVPVAGLRPGSATDSEEGDGAEEEGEDDGAWAVGGSGVWEPASDASIGLA